MAFDIKKAIKHLREVEPKLAPVIERHGPVPPNTLGRGGSVFSNLLRAIVYQQLSGKAAATIHGRLMQRLGVATDAQMLGAGGGLGEPDPGKLLLLPVEELRACGLSAAKAASAIDLATRVRDGLLPDERGMEALSDQEVLEAVSAVRGIGPWSAQMFLMFRLGRPDVLPASDLGVRKGFALVISNRVAKSKDGLPDPKAILKRGERWAPYRTVASWYLWRALE